MRTLSRTPGGVLKSTGDVSSPLTGTVVQASYETPYLAHATMEPMNATADVHPDRVTLWAPTQAQTNAQAVAARIAGVPIAAVTLIPTYIGGGFGRRGESDYVADAVEVSKAAGLPIQLVWTREDDIRYDTFRPGSVAALTASLAPGGRISTLKQTLVSPSITARLAPSRMKDGVDPAAGNGLTNLAYAIPNQLVDWHRLDVAIPVGDWRAPYANSNTFVIESFIDELAHAANEDPVAFRLAMLDAGSRPHVVLERVAKLAHWGSSMPAGHARGVAIGQWNGSWIAIVAEVSKRASGLRVEQMLASVDVGQPINIDGLEQQLESAMSFGLSAALTGKITFADGGAVEKNFIDYPVLRMVDSPKFVCDIVPSTAKSSGAGEIGVPCVAPALANAMFALDGIRIRTLPLTANS
jgi:isoquinoline 1-oxidoreductase beta subunit